MCPDLLICVKLSYKMLINTTIHLYIFTFMITFHSTATNGIYFKPCLAIKRGHHATIVGSVGRYTVPV